jgi:trehalose/maltose hydrolase-like predicted phosphorylase
MAIVNGFGGVRDYDGRLSLDPHLPRMWQSLEFSLRFRERQLRIRPSHDESATRWRKATRSTFGFATTATCSGPTNRWS